MLNQTKYLRSGLTPGMKPLYCSYNFGCRLIFICLFSLLFGITSKAQYTTIHYIPPSPWQYTNNANELVITTMSTTPVAVTIATSDGAVITNSLTTVYGTPLTYRFTTNGVSANTLNTVLSGRGLIVSALSPIGVQVRNIASDNVSCFGNCYGTSGSTSNKVDCSQKGNSAFTSLGDQGLGTGFRLGYYINANGSGWNCNNETQAPIYAFMAIYNGTNLYLNGKLITTLNAGQSYLLQTTMGSEVTSTLPLVATSGMRVDDIGGCGDGVCGQMIPENYLGNKYVVVRATGNTTYEQSTIIATQPNTTVTVSVTGGSTTSYTLANVGSFVTVQNGNGSTAYSSCYITSTSPVAVYSGSAAGCEIDMIVQPPITTCAGSFDVQTTKFLSNVNTGNAVLPYFGYVLVQSDTAVVYFNGANLEKVSGITARSKVSTSGFSIILFTNTQLGNPTNIHFQANARINVAMIESGAGYSMSSFISSISNSMPPPSLTSNCLPSVFTAQPGFTTYQWYYNSTAISGATTQTYTPTKDGLYSVSGNTIACGSTAISPSVTINPKPTINANQIVCNGTSVTLTGSTPSTGNWIVQSNNPGGATMGNTTNGVATVAFGNTAVGTFNFIYSAGCSDTGTVVVKATSTSTTNASICTGGSYTFNGTKYSTAGTYTVHLTNSIGCDSAATLVLAVKSPSTSTTTASICTGGSYIFNGTSYSTAGTYLVHLTNSVGCDSAATLILAVNSPSTSTNNVIICTGGLYTFNNTTYTSSGTYVAHLTNSAGCDSAATLILKVNSPSASATTASICAGSSYRFNGSDYTSAGTYVAHLLNSVGCDSAATLVLAVKSTSTSTTSATIALGSSYSFNGVNYSNAGTYTAHLTNSAGCDSAATLVLTVVSYSNVVANICSGGSYLFNGTSYSTSGTYTAHLRSSLGIDSVATLILTVKPTSTSTTNVSICNGATYTFNGTGYTSAGTYTVHLTNSIGCDSTATLVLTVKSLSTSTTTASICAGGAYTFNGTTYNTAGTYVAHLTNSVGCDSAATLILSIKLLSTSTTTASICAGTSYTFNGTAYSTAGTYVAHLTNSVGCDSAATLILTVKATSTSTTTASICSGGSYTFNGNTYTNSGTYTVHFTNAVGCDSAASLVLTVNANPTVAAITGTTSVCSGSTTTLSCSTTGGVWSSNTLYVATVAANGVVTGVGAGASTINYTVTNASGCSTTVSTNYLVNPVPAVTAITGTKNVCIGTISSLADASIGGTWASNNTSIATVSTGGILTGIATGSTSVTYTLASASGCSSSITSPVSVGAASSSTTTAKICNGGSYTFNGTAYTTEGTYVAHLTNAVGCDSAATLILTVNPLSSSSTTASICSGGSYTFNGYTYSTAGTYVVHLTNSAGCDSVVTLYLTVKSLSTSTTTASICNGGSYTFCGASYNTAGIYTVHLTNAAGCDSAAILVLSVKSPSTSTTSASICSGGSYTFNGTTYNTSGTYIAHLTNAVGCDSVATLILSVKPVSGSTTTVSICSGATYTFNGSTYNAAGTYVAHLTNAIGCDSVATLILTVKPVSNSITPASICAGATYTFNGATYNTSGTYTAHLTNSVGCDSIATLVLAVKALSTSTTTISICNGGSYTFNGTVYNTAGRYVSHLTNAVGCDSAATLVLTVKAVSTSTTTASICAGGNYTFNGTSYNTAGTYVAHLTNAVGCDSAATLVLTVKALSTSTTSASICTGGSYTFNGTAYTKAGSYVAHLTNAVGCDSAATLILTINAPSTSTTSVTVKYGGSYTFNGTTYTASGTYLTHLTNAAGCDSTATLLLTVKGNGPTYSYLGSWDANGVPGYLISPKDTVPTDLLKDLICTLPEGVNLTTSSQAFMLNSKNVTDINLTQRSDVFVTFMSENTENNNSFGYYVYPTNNPPTTFKDIDNITFVYPNCKFNGDGGGLIAGSKVKIGTWGADTTIGLVLYANAWNSTNQTINTGATPYFTDAYLNPEAASSGKQQHAVFLQWTNPLTNQTIYPVCFEDQNRTNGTSDNDFNDVGFYVTTSNVNAINSNNIAQVSKSVDTDGDGVCDALDAYPNDPTRAYNNFYPSPTTYGTYAYEDNWPVQGDYDMNDLVVSYRYNLVTNAQNQVVEIKANFAPIAAGATYQNGFGLQLPFASSAVSSVTGQRLSNGYITLNGNGTEARQTNAVIIPFDNSRQLISNPDGNPMVNTLMTEPKVTGDTSNIDIILATPQNNVDPGTFNPFCISNLRRGYEIHLPNFVPTNLADKTLFGTGQDASNPVQGIYYVTKDNYPFGININQSFSYPVETVAIYKAYLHFLDWSASMGTTFLDWYNNSSLSYKNSVNIYSK